MRVLCLALLAAIVAATPASLPAAAAPGAPWPAVSLSASAAPSRLLPGATVTYTDALTNTGDVAGSGVRLTHTLPTGFTYVAGSAGIYRDGILIGRTEPTIAGHTLSWSGLTVPPRRGDGFSGINTMVQERCDIGYITWQLDHVRNLMGSGAWAKQLFYGITAATTAPQPCWIDYVNAAYDRGLKPVIRLAGVHGGSFWHKPQPDGPGNYTSIAQAFARVAAQLPRRDWAHADHPALERAEPEPGVGRRGQPDRIRPVPGADRRRDPHRDRRRPAPRHHERTPRARRRHRTRDVHPADVRRRPQQPLGLRCVGCAQLPRQLSARSQHPPRTSCAQRHDHRQLYAPDGDPGRQRPAQRRRFF